MQDWIFKESVLCIKNNLFWLTFTDFAILGLS